MMRYIISVLMAALLFISPVSADFSIRPVPTAIGSNIYVDGSLDGSIAQVQYTTMSYTLYLPVDLPVEMIGTVSVLLKVFDGYSWYTSTDDTIYSPVSNVQNGYLDSLTVPVLITTSGLDKIHEVSLCYEQYYLHGNDPTPGLVCNAFRVYTDDGNLYTAGYGVDWYVSSDLTPFTTLYYLDEYFFTDNSKLFYCTVYDVMPELCDALVPVPGLGWFDPNFMPPDPPLLDPDNPESSYNSLSGLGQTVSQIVYLPPVSWWDQVTESVDSTMDENVYRGFVYVFEDVLPDFQIDVTPLNILSDYLYFFGVYLSTVQAIVPLDLLVFAVNISLIGTAFLWFMLIYRFIRTLVL